MLSNLSPWQFLPESKELKHLSGLTLLVEGPLKEPTAIMPAHIPTEMNALELARLIREGMEYCRQAPHQLTTENVTTTKKRPVLSLKRPERC